MKKYNSKQLAYSQKKVNQSMLRIFSRLLLVLCMAFIVPTVVSAISNPEDISAGVKMMGGAIILFTMADIGNLAAPSDRDTAPNQIGFRLWLLAMDQVDDTATFPSANTARQLGNIPRKAGEYWHHFDGVNKSLKYAATAEKGDITSTFNKTFEIIIKHTTEALNFLESYHGKGFCMAYKECEVDTIYEIGSYCKPIYLNNFEVKHDGEGKYIKLTFGNDHWRQPLIYTGTISELAATTVAADATELVIASGQGAYTLSDGSVSSVPIATVSGIASSDYGRHVTVFAPATATYPPTIADNTVFILKDAATWTANPGSSITFQILDDSTLVEESRVQIT